MIEKGESLHELSGLQNLGPPCGFIFLLILSAGFNPSSAVGGGD